MIWKLKLHSEYINKSDAISNRARFGASVRNFLTLALKLDSQIDVEAVAPGLKLHSQFAPFENLNRELALEMRRNPREQKTQTDDSDNIENYFRLCDKNADFGLVSAATVMSLSWITKRTLRFYVRSSNNKRLGMSREICIDNAVRDEPLMTVVTFGGSHLSRYLHTIRFDNWN